MKVLCVMQTQYNGWTVTGNDLSFEQELQLENELPELTFDVCDEDGELEGEVNEQAVVDFVKSVVGDCEIAIEYDTFSS